MCFVVHLLLMRCERAVLCVRVCWWGVKVRCVYLSMGCEYTVLCVCVCACVCVFVGCECDVCDVCVCVSLSMGCKCDVLCVFVGRVSALTHVHADLQEAGRVVHEVLLLQALARCLCVVQAVSYEGSDAIYTCSCQKVIHMLRNV